jgi:sigma-B regulation protein RsbU (phosphoserine phosphatase)
MVSRTQLRAIATLGAASPDQILAKVNIALCEGNDSCMFVTGIYAVFDPYSARLSHVNFGHPQPLLIHADGQIHFVDSPPGIALGLMVQAPYQHTELKLIPGDILVLYTDGVTEAMNPELEEFGTKRLLAVFKQGPPPSATAAIQQIIAAVDAFSGGAQQSDDITCVALHYHP